jgi:hypothetical protein
MLAMDQSITAAVITTDSLFSRGVYQLFPHIHVFDEVQHRNGKDRSSFRFFRAANVAALSESKAFAL